MTVSRKLITTLRRELKSQANPRLAVRGQAYVKSAMPLYGLETRTLRKICKAIFQQFPLSGFEQWQDTVLAMWRTAKYREERYCAILLCDERKYSCYQTLATLPMYEEMIVTGAWWDLVDPIAAHRIRHLLSLFPQQMVPVLKRWSGSEDVWKRRAAILSQLRLKDKTNLDLLYQCIKPSLDSREFFLQKAIGWALRDYAWHDDKEIIRYVAANKNRLSKLSQREALKNVTKSNR